MYMQNLEYPAERLVRPLRRAIIIHMGMDITIPIASITIPIANITISMGTDMATTSRHPGQRFLTIQTCLVSIIYRGDLVHCHILEFLFQYLNGTECRLTLSSLWTML